MAVHFLVPVGIGAAAVVTAVGLRLRALAKGKTKSAVILPAASPPAAVTPPALRITTNPDGSPHEIGTPFVFDSNKAALDALAEAKQKGISVHQLVLEKEGLIPPGAAETTGVGAIAQVTTNDPAPSGDLIIREAPSLGARQIGGAEKDGIVTILDATDPIFAKIFWAGGDRLPSATGFARKAFLKVG